MACGNACENRIVHTAETTQRLTLLPSSRFVGSITPRASITMSFNCMRGRQGGTEAGDAAVATL